MAKPIYLYNQVTLGANGRGTITLQGGEGETITIRRIYMESTGDFRLLRVRTSGGADYVSDQNGNGIPSLFFTQIVQTNEGVSTLVEPISIAPAELLYFEVQDTSGSTNQVWLLLVGERE